jgi:hypothetical protein
MGTCDEIKRPDSSATFRFARWPSLTLTWQAIADVERLGRFRQAAAEGAATMLALPKQLATGPIHVLLTPLSIQAVAPECR